MPFGILCALACAYVAWAAGSVVAAAIQFLCLAVAVAAAVALRRSEALALASSRCEQQRLEEMCNELIRDQEQQQGRMVSLNARLQKFPSLSRACQELGTTLELDGVYELVVCEAVRLTDGGERGCLFISDPDSGGLVCLATYPTRSGSEGSPSVQEVDSFAFERRQPYLSDRAATDVLRFDPRTSKEIGSFMVAPIMASEGRGKQAKRRCVGVLRVTSSEAGKFGRSDLEMLTIVATLAGMAIQNARLYGRCKELAIKDGLTGLYSQHYFKERFEEELSRAAREGDRAKLSVLMIDIDHFKQYNDTFGHPAGDVVLRRLAQILTESRQAGDIVARYGGEEFAVVMHVGAEAAAEFAERLRGMVEQTKFAPTDENQDYTMTISVGVSTFPANGVGADELIEGADSALYEAKRSGRNKVCCA